MICKHERVVVKDEEFGLLIDWIVIVVETVDECDAGRFETNWRNGGSGGTFGGERITGVKSDWDIVKGIDA